MCEQWLVFCFDQIVDKYDVVFVQMYLFNTIFVKNAILWEGWSEVERQLVEKVAVFTVTKLNRES